MFQRVDHIVYHDYDDNEESSLSAVTFCPVLMKLLQGSPFLSRCDSLKKKMAAFQCLMEDEEDEQKKNEENESLKSTLAKDSENGQSILKLSDIGL